MILQVLVDLVHLELLSSLEVLTADVASGDLEVNFAVMVVVEVGAREGEVAGLALLLGVVVVDVVLELTVATQDLSAGLAKLAFGRLRVNPGDVAVTLRFLCEGSEEKWTCSCCISAKSFRKNLQAISCKQRASWAGWLAARQNGRGPISLKSRFLKNLFPQTLH